MTETVTTVQNDGTKIQETPHKRGIQWADWRHWDFHATFQVS